MRRIPVIMVLEILAFLNIPAQSGVSGKQVLLIQPLGTELPNEDMALVKQALVGFYNVQIRVLPRVDLPDQAYYEPRRRYRAEKILPFLLEMHFISISILQGKSGLLEILEMSEGQEESQRKSGLAGIGRELIGFYPLRDPVKSLPVPNSSVISPISLISALRSRPTG